VPIYYGARDIAQFVPRDSFIDMRQFNSFEQLDDFLFDLTENDYFSYLDRITKYYPSFLKSSFSDIEWAKTVSRHCLSLLHGPNA